MIERESMEFDVLIVGAGPAGLSAAVRLAQLNQTKKKSLSIALVEKSASIGGHILSGAVLETAALDELLPHWKSKNTFSNTAVKKDFFYYLTQNKRLRLPKIKRLQNKNNYIISLGELCKYLAQEAESLGIHIFPGFPATKILYKNGKVIGIQTQDCGINKNDQVTERLRIQQNNQLTYRLEQLIEELIVNPLHLKRVLRKQCKYHFLEYF